MEVLAEVIKPEERSSVTSNSFNFTFGVSEHADGSGKAALANVPGAPELRRVLPSRLRSSILIAPGMRHGLGRLYDAMRR